MLASVMLISLAWGAAAYPAEHKNKYASPALKALGAELADSSSDCGEENRMTASGNQWFTAAGCRVASREMDYVQKDGSFATAQPNALIKPDTHGLDSVYWPSPLRKDCYFYPGTCNEETEWCMVDIHEKWGPWAESPNGGKAEPMCNEPYFGFDVSELTAEEKTDLELSIKIQLCGGVYCPNKNSCSATDYEQFVSAMNTVAGGDSEQPVPDPWRPARGVCVKYRQEDQSCYATHTNVGGFYTDAFVAKNDAQEASKGGSLDRPLACAPGLVCTGSDFGILPSTCVKERPSDLCFAGPWWDSSTCPRTSMDEHGQMPPCGGMTDAFAKRALMSTMLLFPSEVVYPASCVYWTKGGQWYKRANVLRKNIYSIFKTLWPQLEGIGPIPDFDVIEKDFHLPSITRAQCDAAEALEVEEAVECTDSDRSPRCLILHKLLEVEILSSSPNLVWSLIHWVMHNLPSTMSLQQVQASKAIASILQQNFWCNDCRGFFVIGVLGSVGYPPDSNDSTDHAKYWNTGHNIAGEHVATTRGGHPWIYQLSNQSSGSFTGDEFQNPFFMSFEKSAKQWMQDTNCN